MGKRKTPTCRITEGGLIMKVSEFIEHLKMFGEDTEVYVQTTPNDLCQPINRKLIGIIEASHNESYGFTPHKVLITAYIPHDAQKGV